MVTLITKPVVELSIVAWRREHRGSRKQTSHSLPRPIVIQSLLKSTFAFHVPPSHTESDRIGRREFINLCAIQLGNASLSDSSGSHTHSEIYRNSNAVRLV